MPFMDPAFAMAVCRYDLSDGPLKLSVPVSPAYTSVSFYTRNDVAYYAINDRAAGRRVIELDLMTSAQRGELPDDEEVTAADRLIVELPTSTGLIVIKALAPEPGLMPARAGRARRREMRACRRRRPVRTDAPSPAHGHRAALHAVAIVARSASPRVRWRGRTSAAVGDGTAITRRSSA